jgi:hypothetical protein
MWLILNSLLSILIFSMIYIPYILVVSSNYYRQPMFKFMWEKKSFSRKEFGRHAHPGLGVCCKDTMEGRLG